VVSTLDDRLRALCAQVSRELGVAIPEPLDGLELPFATIFPRDRFATAAGGWVRFGHDNYFSDFLCRNGSVAVWDRELGGPVEAAYDDVVEMLTDLYADFLDGKQADLAVTQVNDRLERVIAILKPLTAMPTANLLTALRSPPARFRGIDCATGIRAVRELHALGVACHFSGFSRTEI
jgi:hypothetical protein